ncbi:hypothetical protein EZS27_030303 [termite gut metagenome]|uniref:Uncharacterized protein n=1 Tax=termite gut metagenome TaxID=433724 RepID=A0A5J4QFX9_9ZZZZ
MEKWTKTDIFIELLNDAIYSVRPICFGEFLHKENIKENVMKNLAKQYYILSYRLFGIPEITLENDNNKEDVKRSLEKGHITTEPYFDVLYDVLNSNYPNYKDLGTELWNLCPNIESLSKYIQVSRGKFKEILENLPDKDYYSIENMFFDDTSNDISIKIKTLGKAGILNKKESDYILFKVCNIVELINTTIDTVAKMYNDLKAMTLENEYTSNAPQPDTKNEHFTYMFDDGVAKRKYDELIKGRYIDKETDFNHFVYWFSGGVLPDNLKPINWIESQGLLARLVDTMFSDLGLKHWEITRRAFLVKGEAPNTNTMKKDTSDIKNEHKLPPKGSDSLDELLLK